jgi:hypothetical protein
MAIKRSATSKDSDRARKARLDARTKSGSKGLKTTTGQRRAVVSDIEAKRVARTAVGRYPQSKKQGPKNRDKKTGPIARLTGRGSITVSTPKKRAGITKTQNNPVTVTRTTPKTREEIAKGIAQERYNRLTSVLRPIVSPSRKKVSKAFIGPKRGSTVQVAKPGKAKEENKLITARRTRKGDRATGDIPKQTESRRVAAKNASQDSRNVSQPSNKTPEQREQEQRRDKTESRPTRRSSTNDPQQREADRRVREGMKDRKKIDKLEGKKPAPRARTWGGRGGGLRGGGMLGGGGGMSRTNR